MVYKCAHKNGYYSRGGISYVYDKDDIYRLMSISVANAIVCIFAFTWYETNLPNSSLSFGHNLSGWPQYLKKIPHLGLDL